VPKSLYVEASSAIYDSLAEVMPAFEGLAKLRTPSYSLALCFTRREVAVTRPLLFKVARCSRG
jgi:hypothetical protein